MNYLYDSVMAREYKEIGPPEKKVVGVCMFAN